MKPTERFILESCLKDIPEISVQHEDDVYTIYPPTPDVISSLILTKVANIANFLDLCCLATFDNKGLKLEVF